MKNSTNIKIPKKYHKMIKNLYHDGDGYWLNTNKGYYAAGTDFECHVIHVDTQAEILEQIQLIKSCDCDYCKSK